MTALVTLLAIAATPEDAKLEKFFRTYLDTLCQQRPAAATAMGEHKYDHLLDDLSEKGVAAREGLDSTTLAALKKDAEG